MTVQARLSGENLSSDGQFTISIEVGGVRIASYRDSGSVVITRASASSSAPTHSPGTVSLPSRYVSRPKHCTVERLNGSYFRVVDHQSTNGTRVRGQPLDGEVTTPAPCRIQIHPFELVLTLGTETDVTAPLRSGSDRPSDLRIDEPTDSIVTPGGHAVRGLTPFQLQLVKILVYRHPRWVTSGELASAVGTTGGSEQGIYSQIHLIRRRLAEAEPGADQMLVSQRHRGYALTPRPT